MGRPKAAQNCKIKPWLSAKADCKDGRFLQIGNSFLLSKQYQDLRDSSKNLYLCMALESGGHSTVKFTHLTAKKYGIAKNTFERGVKQLLDAGFIERKNPESVAQFAPGEYRFIFRWKENPHPKLGNGAG